MKDPLVRLCLAASLAALCSFAPLARAQAPTISGLSNTEYNGGTTPITISGTNFGSTLGTSTIAWSGTTQPTPTFWSSTSITFLPAGTTSGNLVVTVGSTASNPAYMAFVSAPIVTSIDPATGAAGSLVVLAGSNLAGCSAVKYNGTGGGTVTPTSVDDGSITFKVPSGASGAGTFTATCPSASPNSPSFTVAAATMPVDPGLQSGHSAGANNAPVDFQGQGETMFGTGGARFGSPAQVVGGQISGFGPRFNSSSCQSCHSQTSVGGASPTTNPQATLISGNVASSGNTLPAFIKSSGPVLEARFLYLMDTNGAVNTDVPTGLPESIFTVPSTACTLSQPNFSAAIAANNITYRTPIAIFGDGLIENLDDSTLLKNLVVNLSNSFAIAGSFNRSPDDGSIARFGWKAQVRSLQQFAGQALNVEMGVTNLLFTSEHGNPEDEMVPGATGLPSSCLGLSGSGYPEDIFQPSRGFPENIDTAQALAFWMRFIGPPIPATSITGSPAGSPTIAAGQATFASIGCQGCHNQSPGTTQASNFGSANSNVTPLAWSDFEIHHMGSNLADNIAQGYAGGDQFRTAPLWGVGGRAFFLHDARDTNLLDAIEDHAGNGSEANAVISNFNSLSPANQQGVLNFLRSL